MPKYFLFVSFALCMQSLRADDTVLRRAEVQPELRAAIQKSINGSYRSGCFSKDTFVRFSQYSGDLRMATYIRQLADFDWQVKRAELTVAQKRNGITFRGFLIITASAYREFDHGHWTDWREPTGFESFDIIKRQGVPWSIELQSDSSMRTQFARPTCKEIEEWLSSK